jgi:phage terminase large subunit-like protein
MKNLSKNEKLELLKAIEQKIYVESRRKFYRWFPDKTRHLYSKHTSFMSLGATYRQRAYLAANRCGKTETGAFEITCHASGLYPKWWTGKRFDEPTKIWIVGKNSETIRETTQVSMLGNPGEWGTGMIPGDLLINITKNNSRADTITVKHVSGGISYIGFKSNEAGRQSFEGTAMHVIWIDEECDLPVYTECMMRTMTTNGIIFATFTPLKGLTSLIKSFLKNGDLDTPNDGFSISQCTWADVPHLDKAACDEMLATMSPHQRLARSKGIPQLGSGAIYPVEPETYTVNPFEIPKHWLRINALDVGWRMTAAVFGAINPDDGILYIYSEHYMSAEEPSIHAKSIKARGDILTIIDSAAHGRSQIDGHNLFDLYKDQGLRLVNANKSVETGLYAVWEMFTSRRLKIFSNCQNIFGELKTYSRDDQGKIIKADDHLMDSLRYLVMGRDAAHSLVPKVINHNDFYTASYSERTGI